MDTAGPPFDRSNPEPPDEAIAETQALRRKVVFWRRVAGLALGGAAIILLVVWTRGQTRQRECYEALHTYAQMARANHLGEQHPDILEQQWQSLDPGTSLIAPEHYDLIARNWGARQSPDVDLVLAVCRNSHLLLFKSGRHVLKRHGDGFVIEWLSEEEAAPIAAEARRDNHPR